MDNIIRSVSMPEFILDQAGIFAYIDQFGKYIYVNKAWEEATGIIARRAVGHRVDELMNGSAAMIAIRNSKQITGEVFMTSAAGREIMAVMRYQPVFDMNGRVTGCLEMSVFDTIEDAQHFSSHIEQIMEEFDYLQSYEQSASGTAKYNVDNIIGESQAMREVKEQIYIAGASGASCLIEGETGTGKELVAHSIHNVSTRRIFPFVRVNCSAIPENLMESEFFGYEEGSFTGGAKGGRIGKFERAHLGSMFLDEINAMNLSMQPKLLRVLQEKEIERIGGSESIGVNVRVIAASNMPLEELVEQGSFRRDLFYRLNIITIGIPPLRDRKEDIYPLVKSFIARNNRDSLGQASDITDDAINYLMEYDWPGNVRELQNAVDRAMASTWSDTLDVVHFQKFGIRKRVFGKAYDVSNSSMGRFDGFGSVPVKAKSAAEPLISLEEQKAESEKKAVLEALEKAGGNKSKAAKLLNISRTLLYKKLEKYQIS